MRARSFPTVFLGLFSTCLSLLLALSACSSGNINSIPTPTPAPTSYYTLAGGGSCVRLGSHPQPPYANIQASHDSYLAHSETMLVEDPANPLYLVGGSKFFTDPAHYRFQIGYYASHDGGCTWKDGGVLPGFRSNLLTSDPSFAFGLNNRVYAAVLFSVPALNGESGIAVSTSTDGGLTFGPPTIVFDDNTGKVFSDKPWIAVDQTRGLHSGNIYVVWSYDHHGFYGDGNYCSEELGFSRSTDGGKTFSPVRQVEGKAPFCNNKATGRPANSTLCDAVQGAIPLVEPDGTVAVAFPYIDLMSGSTPTRLIVTTSPDAGNNWTTPVLIATIHDIAGRFPPERYRTLSLPAFACDPRTGQLYITWSDKGKTDADLLFIASKDHGQTWTAPIRVNDDPVNNGANHFQPQMAVATDGVISISFFDTRLDPQHKLIDVYLAQSVNHGISFLKNVRVTTQSWDPAVGAPTDEYGNQFIGDYQGIAADDHFVHPFWNDTRTGKQEAFTAAVPSAQPNGNVP
ncbi:MAG TPA: sialidase family protein [Ktedonobacteraceae bacterium]|nr:sialidase family protein [Ktedonobacteraceae bacterium]